MIWIFLYLLLGMIIGYVETKIVGKILINICNKRDESFKKLIICISGISFAVAYMRIGYKIELFLILALSSILIIISTVDLKSRIIPNLMVVITFAVGVLFIIILKKPFLDSFAGMLTGGGILLILALIPGVMGGGDVKLMFALGGILGLNKTLYAITAAFIAAAIISIVLLLFKVIERKDAIPFGPFLALGSFIAILFI